MMKDQIQKEVQEVRGRVRSLQKKVMRRFPNPVYVSTLEGALDCIQQADSELLKAELKLLSVLKEEE